MADDDPAAPAPAVAQPAHPASAPPSGPSPVATSAGPSSEAVKQLSARLRQVYPNIASGECVALAQAMGGVGNVHDWRRGLSIKDARPPVGTPVSTFGWSGDSDKYAYGGSGTRGIGRDHAGIISGYTDKGVWLLNQWHGQAPVHTFYAWEGQGEHGGQNYYTIHSPGQPLGPQFAGHGEPSPHGGQMAAMGHAQAHRMASARPQDGQNGGPGGGRPLPQGYGGSGPSLPPMASLTGEGSGGTAQVASVGFPSGGSPGGGGVTLNYSVSIQASIRNRV
jgi:hypothetical protein